ncbi:hypothetical protein SOM12_06570 [Flavobacterium sp. CFBP9031]|uniref:hypothetical protein n=1 Tax=Flavobacterium sp. CFBP9031 TaxID=3096538 RepID=UPI002A6A1EAC|nr:hypothetical protein [Flavobacterium sp. CFBP9031]MDY0987072.1 hypothetical protein [Flavobacterium sp. CFBP9031]
MKQINEKVFREIIKWLEKKFSLYPFVEELYLIGSSLEKSEINDIDIVQKVNLNSTKEIQEFAQKLISLEQEFLYRFNLPLHITSFLEKDNNNFIKFMSLNKSKKII